jgi:Domain of unknown function (DUF4296)
MIMKRIALLSTLFLFSCGNKNALPKGILKPEKMQIVLWDVLRADVFTNDFIKKDSTKKPEQELVKLQQQIFAIHKVSKDEFYKSYEFYKAHPEIMQPMLDSMINRKTRDKYPSNFSKPSTDTLKVN